MQQNVSNKLSLLSLRKAYTHPYELYDALRERDHVYFDHASQSWLVTGHKATTAILDDSRFISGLSSATNASSSNMSLVSKQMLFMDGEHHRKAQDVMLRPLALMVKQMPETIRAFAQQLLAKCHGSSKIELVSEFASPVSLLTIAHVLGMPTQDHELLHLLESWSDTFGDVTSGYFRGDLQDIKKLEQYFSQLIAQRRRTPGNDLLSAFIEAKESFPDEESLVANCMMVFAAGRITTKKLLGNGLSLLLPHWKQYQTAYKENPRFARMLGEELLRMVTPTRCLIREAREDIDLSSPGLNSHHTIRQGQRMLLFLEAANYDPEVFPHPGLFDPQRRPNKHLAFGYGPHQCPGATLARVEIQIALEEILGLPDLRSDPTANPVWNPNPNLGGYTVNPAMFGSHRTVN